MATACWAFIVAKSTVLETASLLGFCGVARLQHENSSTSYAQDGVHRLWTRWRPAEVAREHRDNPAISSSIVPFRGARSGMNDGQVGARKPPAGPAADTHSSSNVRLAHKVPA